MIRIEKTQEPDEWTIIRLTPGLSFDGAVKTELRQSLLLEQGYICGYCQRRIDVNNSRIEHVKPQSQSIANGRPEEMLDHGNMIICCDGDITGHNSYKLFHCDRKKGETPIHFSPFSATDMATVSYSSKDGLIRSSHNMMSKDINDKNREIPYRLNNYRNT